MAILRIHHYLPGSGRKTVVTETGERISRQQAENLFAQRYGYRTEYERRQGMRSEGMREFMSRTNRSGESTYDNAMREAMAHGTSRAEANAAFSRFYSSEGYNNWRDRDVSPNGPLAQMLVAMGRRDPNATYNVGDSPSIH